MNRTVAVRRYNNKRAKALGILAAVLIKSFWAEKSVKDLWDTDPGKFWQEIVDDAFEIWRTAQDPSSSEDDPKPIDDFRTLLKVLAPYQKIATGLGKFMQQVYNGGMSQWIANGYADKPAIIRYCRTIGTPKLMELASMLEKTDMRSVDGWVSNGKQNQRQFEKWLYDNANGDVIEEEIAAWLYNEAIEGRIA